MVVACFLLLSTLSQNGFEPSSVYAVNVSVLVICFRRPGTSESAVSWAQQTEVNASRVSGNGQRWHHSHHEFTKMRTGRSSRFFVYIIIHTTFNGTRIVSSIRVEKHNQYRPKLVENNSNIRPFAYIWCGFVVISVYTDVRDYCFSTFVYHTHPIRPSEFLPIKKIIVNDRFSVRALAVKHRMVPDRFKCEHKIKYPNQWRVLHIAVFDFWYLILVLDIKRVF